MTNSADPHHLASEHTLILQENLNMNDIICHCLYYFRENELLKHQLRKYVNAVQMLRTEGAQVDGRFLLEILEMFFFFLV